MKFFNTYTRKLQNFVPVDDGKVKMYVCGPTVYDLIHIGNARPIVIFDCLRQYLVYRGFEVTYVQNFTDVDDKIIKRAIEQNVSFDEVVRKNILEYEKDVQGLRVEKPTFAPRVSENVDLIIDFIQNLINKGCAYEAAGDVIFKTESFKNYGKLSRMDLNSLNAGARIELSKIKQNKLDFVLWKAAKPNEPFWASPWGNGRPGWHIECSAMASEFAAKTLDFHCGGRDLIFPHHENEIAQSECKNGVRFANCWLHNGHITVNSKKMSKSLGNFFTVRQIADEFGYDVLRFLLVQAHYRAPISYDEGLMKQCVSALDRIKTFRQNLNFAITKSVDGVVSESLLKKLNCFKSKFFEALDFDFNTADAVAVIFELIKNMADFVSLKIETSKQNLIEILNLFEHLVGLLKIVPEELQVKVPQHVLELFQRRNEARKLKQFDVADSLRNEIEKLGYCVEETRKGSRLILKK